MFIGMKFYVYEGTRHKTNIPTSSIPGDHPLAEAGAFVEQYTQASTSTYTCIYIYIYTHNR